MLLPYGTDAPVYYYPFATIGIIGINAAMFLVTGMGDYHDYRWLILEYDRINPLQWVTAAFMHASWCHLIGNMIFLWCFGLVVEGKLGWYRFSLLYLGLALADGAIGQIPMFVLYGGEGGALGASGVIFALLAVCCIWAPHNDIHFLFLWGWFFITTLEFPIYAVAAFYIAQELLCLWLLDWQMSTPMLHLMGASVGVPFAIVMLKQNRVDCEGWDLFTRSGIPIPSLPIGKRVSAAKRESKPEVQRPAATDKPTHAGIAMKVTTTGKLVEDLQQIRDQERERDSDALPGRDPRSVAIGAFGCAVRSGQAGQAMQSFQSLQRLGCVQAIDDRALVTYVKLLTQHDRQRDCLVPLRLLVARRSPHANDACLRIASIELQHNQDPQAAITALRQMKQPVDAPRLRRGKRLFQLAQARLDAGEPVAAKTPSRA